MSHQKSHAGVYGAIPADIVEISPAAEQFSPLVPGARALGDVKRASLDALAILAPPGTTERRHVMALGLKTLAPGGRLTVLAPKDKGGLRIARELEAFGCDVGEEARRHHRICETEPPAEAKGLDEAIAEGGPRLDPKLSLFTQAGIFSYDRIDPGSALLIEALPKLAGRGADLGCGIGILTLAVLAASPKVTQMTLVDIDRRAVEAARRNVEDPRVLVRWADVRQPDPMLSALDFVVMNPPFHDGGIEDRALGQGFIRRAAEMLRPGGFLWLTANRHLPYEEVLKGAFKLVTVKAESAGYKIFEARK